MGRVLAVDPGESRIGLAISDPSKTIARPLRVLRHRSRQADAEGVLQAARESEAEAIVVGVPYDDEGRVGPQARRAMRLAESIRAATHLPVLTWDESGSTQAASGMPGLKASIDALAAAVILQDFLDARQK